MGMTEDKEQQSASTPSAQDPRSRAGTAFGRAVGTFLGVSGLVIFLSSSTLGLYSFGYESWLTLGPIAFSILCMVAWFVLSYRKLTERLSQRKAQYLGLTVGYVIALAAVLGGVNYSLTTSPMLIDMSIYQVHTLSEQSIKVVEQLKEPVRVVGFFEKTDPARALFESFAERYEAHSDMISFEVYAPSYDVEAVRRYQVVRDGPTIIVESGWDDPAKKKERRFSLDLRELNHEEKFTNAIINASLRARKRIYVLTGHGEADPQSPTPGGLKEAVSDLVNQGYDVVPLNLMTAQRIPEDTAALLIPGLTQPLLPPEKAALMTFLDRGGRAAIFLESGKPHGLDSLLGRYGIQANDDVVIDISPFGRMYGDRVAIASSYGQHPVTAKFKNAMTFFPEARTLSINPGTEANPMALVKTSERAWGETDFEALARGEAEWDAGEARGPVVVAIAAERVIGEKDDKGEYPPDAPITRLVVVGDSSFATNEHRRNGENRSLLLNIMSWLAADEDKIAIRPRTRGGNQIRLSPNQRDLIAFFVLYVLPVSLLSIGLGIWLVRRQR